MAPGKLSAILERYGICRLNPGPIVLGVVDERCLVADIELAQISHESSAVNPPPTFCFSTTSLGGVQLEPGVVNHRFQRTIRGRIDVGVDVWLHTNLKGLLEDVSLPWSTMGISTGLL